MGCSHNAILVFADPYVLMEQDRVEGGELRWQTIGMVGGIVVRMVAHTVRDEGVDEIIRIISARRATRKECKRYEESRERKAFAEDRQSAKQKRRLKKLAQRPDSELDFSDIPELTVRFWRNAVGNPFYRPVKKQLTLRLDADVIAWLRRQGKDYQTRANALLRAAMLEDVREKAS